MAEPVSLRERKKAETRRALQVAALELSLEVGLDDVTVERICAVAGFSHRTFFNYFSSKDEAIVGSSAMSLDSPEVERFIAGGPTGRTFDDLATLPGALLEARPEVDDQWSARLLVLAAHPALAFGARTRSVRSKLEGVIRARLAQRGADVAIAPHLAGLAVLAIASALEDWDAENEPFTRSLTRAFSVIAAAAAS